MSEIQPPPAVTDPNPVHPNAKTTTHTTNGTTTTKTNISTPICRNCKTQTTPLWRRDETGQVLCNACGLFLKLHGRPRPISLKTDVIKSRNRVKHPPSLNGKTSLPNTPELKAKEGSNTPKSQPMSYQSQSSSGKFSPKQYKPSAKGRTSPNSLDESPTDSPNLHPLLPRAQNQHHPNASTWTFQQQHHPGGYPSQVQPLHYPSSTPAQFAPNLQQITSPLLLSTTRHQPPNSSSITAAHAAAGALETMSHELPPNSSFVKSDHKSNGVSLLNNSHSQGSPSNDSILNHPEHNDKKPFSPATALTSDSPRLHNSAPKLPALVAAVNNSSIATSPSFGPQFSLNSSKSPVDTPNSNSNQEPISSTNPHSNSNTSNVLPSLKPLINQQNSHSSSSNTSNGNNFQLSTPYQPSSSSQPPSQPPNNNTSSSSSASDEISSLKTRISELELVNDLYRTRIMELEAMEHAARLREMSMKKRLDEMKANLNEQSNRPQQPNLLNNNGHFSNNYPPPMSHNINHQAPPNFSSNIAPIGNPNPNANMGNTLPPIQQLDERKMEHDEMARKKIKLEGLTN